MFFAVESDWMGESVPKSLKPFVRLSILSRVSGARTSSVERITTIGSFVPKRSPIF
jgi:hypothetical protein